MIGPLHHGDADLAGANIAQQFVASPTGLFIGSFLHTIGAIFFAAGIVAYLILANSLRRRRTERGPSLSLLPFAHWFTMVGVVLNGVGGLMRLFEPDHPGLDQLGTSLWVQVLLVKHLFLIIGVGLAIWVTFATQAPEPEEEPLPQLGMPAGRVAFMAIASLATILIATILGVVAGQAPLPIAADDAGGAAAGGDDPAPTGPSEDLPPFLTNSASGSMTATPADPQRQVALVFSVPASARSVTVSLEWTSTASTLDMEIRHLEDDALVAAERVQASPTQVVLYVNETVREGDWSVVVTSSQATREDYQVKSQVNLVQVAGRVIEDVVTLSPTTTFFEINLEMLRNDTFTYSWRVEESPPVPIHFDVHTHRDGEVQYPTEGTYSSLEGNYTQDEDGGVSLLWEPTDADGTKYTTPIRLYYRLEGDFDVFSIVGP